LISTRKESNHESSQFRFLSPLCKEEVKGQGKKVMTDSIEGESFFHQILDISFLMEYFKIFHEKPEMFKWKETELAGRKGVIKSVKALTAEASL
jgi:CRISPR/Cas system endoribonuclease Cas6 (RAMP superfamily)